MHWPWKRQISGDQLVLSWSAQKLTYVLARARPAGGFELLKLGVKHQGTDSMPDFVRRLQALGLKGFDVRIVLLPEQYELLQIETPAVPAEELRAATRYQIRDMVHVPLEDVTIDVMPVGDGGAKSKDHLFVVAASNKLLGDMHEFCLALNCKLSVIDFKEATQRNLQTALTGVDTPPDRANAALVLTEGAQAMLTICANDELFYSRCFELPEGFLSASWEPEQSATAPPAEATGTAYIPVEEYVPADGTVQSSASHDYSNASAKYDSLSSTTTVAPQEDERGQRFLVEVQRALDVWDRSWSSKPLDALHVYAGQRSEELAHWLGARIGQRVLAMDVGKLFAGLELAEPSTQAFCLPLLGELLRSGANQD